MSMIRVSEALQGLELGKVPKVLEPSSVTVLGVANLVEEGERRVWKWEGSAYVGWLVDDRLL